MLHLSVQASLLSCGRREDAPWLTARERPSLLPHGASTARLRIAPIVFIQSLFKWGNDHGATHPPDGGGHVRVRRFLAGNCGGVVVRVLGGDARPDAGAGVSGLAGVTPARPDG